MAVDHDLFHRMCARLFIHSKLYAAAVPLVSVEKQMELLEMEEDSLTEQLCYNRAASHTPLPAQTQRGRVSHLQFHARFGVSLLSFRFGLALPFPALSFPHSRRKSVLKLTIKLGVAVVTDQTCSRSIRAQAT